VSTLRSPRGPAGHAHVSAARRPAARAAALLLAVLCAALLAAAFAASAGALPPPAGPGMVLWAKTYGGSPTAFGHMSAVATDAQGNAFVCGSVGTVGHGGDILISAYNPDGTERWSYRWDGPAHGWDGGRWVSAVLSRKAGLLYAAFDTARTDGHASLGVLCVTTAGKKKWARIWDPPSGLDVDEPFTVLDTSGNLGVGVGTYTDIGSAWVDKKSVVLKFTPKGTRVWAKSWSPPGQACGMAALAAGPGGRLCAVGTTSGGEDSGDVATVMYLANGKLAWTAQWDSAASGLADVGDHARDVCFLADGAVAVLATTKGAGATNDEDSVLMKYSVRGKPDWIRVRDDGRKTLEIPFVLVADTAGNLYAGGWGYGPGGDEDGFLMSYSALGSPRWFNWWTGAPHAEEYIEDLAVAGGRLYFGGERSLSDTKTSWVGSIDTATGVVAWSGSYDGDGAYRDCWVNAIAVVPGKSLFMAGGARVTDDATHTDGVAVRFMP
jgi:hypothetical protein